MVIEINEDVFFNVNLTCCQCWVGYICARREFDTGFVIGRPLTALIWELLKTKKNLFLIVPVLITKQKLLSPTLSKSISDVFSVDIQFGEFLTFLSSHVSSLSFFVQGKRIRSAVL